jgi:hypothetical protein
MAGKVYTPMGDLFESISFELEQALVPVRFGLGHRQLVVAALARLGVQPDAQQSYDWPRQIEDVREKMLARRRFGCFYLGAPHCLAAKQWWFIPSLVNSPWEDEIVMTPRVGSDAVKEMLLRAPHMVQKHATSADRVAEARARSTIIEPTIQDYFRRNWPDFYRAPANLSSYSEPCDHDFRLVFGGHDWKIDVSGQRLNGAYGNPGGGKRAVDWHLLATIDYETSVCWRGVVPGSRYHDVIPIEAAWSPKKFVVLLNCYRAGLPYDLLRTAAISP